MVATTPRLAAEQATLAYGDELVIPPLDLTIPDGSITAIIGPNGCGKSTLLRGLAGMRPARAGRVLLDGQDIHRLPAKEIARRMGLLGQQPQAPDDLAVEDLVQRGRYPHQAPFQPPTREDRAAVERALRLAGVEALRRRPVDRLSGGQRQRAWIAMAVAQETPILLLDEPTTYLDLAHQIEVMDLIQRLNADGGRTIVMVLHDVNEAARVSDHIVAMRAGRIVREGAPSAIVDETLLTELYDVPCDIQRDRKTGRPFYLPRSGPRPERTHAAAATDAFDLQRVQARYGDVVVVRDLSLTIPAGAVTVIIGPNASGKSTLLRSCCRLLRPSAGTIRIEGRDLGRGSHKGLAKRLAVLLQGTPPPAGFSVEDLVAAGRAPHRRPLRRWSVDDAAAVEAALDRCQLCELRDRPLETLSGGQQRRCWFGMALAQATPIVLLDEPTTFLDPAAQIALLDIVRALNHDAGRTVVMVLHDLNLAARYADHLIVMQSGEVVAAGPPRAVVTAGMLRGVFGVEAETFPDPRTGAPICIPHALTAPDPAVVANA